MGIDLRTVQIPLKIHRAEFAPCLVAMLAGGGALGWMVWANGFAVLRLWFFYPSLATLIAMACFLSGTCSARWRKVLWRYVQLWSAAWAILFVAAFAIPPYGTLAVASMTMSMLESARIGPLAAGFVHLMVWACATDILKNQRQERLSGDP